MTLDDAKAIWRFVSAQIGADRAAFNRAFDLPFGVLAGDPPLLEELVKKALR